MKKIKLLAVLGLFYTPMVSAQTITVQRTEGLLTHGAVGHAHASATMNITMIYSGGLASTKSNTFLPDSNESKNFIFPIVLGERPTRKFTISMIPGQTSASYPLPATVGDQVVVPATDPGMTYLPGGYGYAVYIKCVGTNSYTLKPVRLEMMGRGLPPQSEEKENLIAQLEKAVVYPNPCNGFSYLEYKAATAEAITISIINIEGKTIHMIQKDLSAGPHKLPIDIQSAPAGMYFVNWRTNTGISGSIQMIKQ